MTLYVKIMSDENLPDSDSRKAFRLLSDVSAIAFNRAPEAPAPRATPYAYVTFKDMTTESFELLGNVYVMNEAGKTIEKFGVASWATTDYPQNV